MKENRRKNSRGFSLTELAVVLVIVGIALAGIISGSHLMQAAKLNKIISEFTGYVTAINDFRDKYHAWPGDMPNATSFWGTYDAGPPITGTNNGDGNEQIAWNTDGYYAWRHLSLSGMITGNYMGADAGADSFQAWVNVPGSVIPGAMYILSYIGTNQFFANPAGNSMLLAKIDVGGAAANASVLTASDTYLIDKKIDDGNPSDGYFYSTRGTDVATGNCTTPDSTTHVATATYLLTTNDSIVCRPFYLFQ